MTTRSAKPLRQTLLSFGVALAIVVAPHSYASSQSEPRRNGTLTPIAQVQTLPTQEYVK